MAAIRWMAGHKWRDVIPQICPIQEVDTNCSCKTLAIKTDNNGGIYARLLYLYYLSNQSESDLEMGLTATAETSSTYHPPLPSLTPHFQ